MTPPWRSVLFLLWALTALVCLGLILTWMLTHEGQPANGWLILGTLWVGGFALYLMNRK